MIYIIYIYMYNVYIIYRSSLVGIHGEFQPPVPGREVTPDWRFVTFIGSLSEEQRHFFLALKTVWWLMLHHPRCSMVLVYLPTKLGDFVRANVGKYSSTMEHMGIGINSSKIRIEHDKHGE